MSEQNNIAVRFKNVCKTYRLYTSSRRRLLGLFFKSVPHKTKHAVVDMNLTVERGEAVAILGRNGAGKSTMLKMITGVTFPTSGEKNPKRLTTLPFFFPGSSSEYKDCLTCTIGGFRPSLVSAYI